MPLPKTVLSFGRAAEEQKAAGCLVTVSVNQKSSSQDGKDRV
jgi:hypothetical protein